MGQVSGSAARSWHRRRRDQRLGYSALGLGAGGFVLVLAGTLLVTEVVPNLVDEDPPAQRVEPASELSPLGAPEPGGSAAPVRRVTVLEGAVIEPAAPFPGAGSQPPAQTPAEPEPPAGGPGGPDGGPDGPDPEPQPQPEGPVGSTLDPVVQTVADTAGGATGGATTPLTTPVVDLVDGVTDTVDGLLP